MVSDQWSVKTQKQHLLLLITGYWSQVTDYRVYMNAAICETIVKPSGYYSANSIKRSNSEHHRDSYTWAVSDHGISESSSVHIGTLCEKTAFPREMEAQFLKNAAIL